MGVIGTGAVRMALVGSRLGDRGRCDRWRGHVFVNVIVIVLVKRKIIRVTRVLITVELHQEQQRADDHKADVGDVAKLRERRGVPPAVEDEAHHEQGGDLPEFDADVEREDFHHEAVMTERQLLQPRREAEPVNQPETKDGPEQIGRSRADVFFEAVEVIESLVADRERDDRVDQEIIRADVEQRGEDQRDAVPKGERGDELHDVFETREEEHHPEQEQQVIVTGEHVARAEFDELERAGGERGSLIGSRHAVGECGEGDAEKGGDEQEAFHIGVKMDLNVDSGPGFGLFTGSEAFGSKVGNSRA